MAISISAPSQVTQAPERHVLHTLPVTTAGFDALAITGAIAAAAAVRHRGILFDSLATVPDIRLVGVLIGMGWIALIGVRGGYQKDVFGVGVDEYKRIVTGSALAAGTVGITCFLLDYPLSRGFFVAAFVIGVPALLLERLALRKLLQRARRRGHLRQRVLIVGGVGAVEDIARVLQRETWLGYEIVGALTPMTDVAVETPSGVPVLANTDETAAVAVQRAADVVILAGGGLGSANDMRQLLWKLETAHVHVVVAPAMTEISSERLKIRPVGGLPLVHVEKPRADEALSWAKRVFDVLAASSLLLLFAPLVALLAIGVRSHDGGPVLFRQERVGRGGGRFACLKLRTMATDAEERRAELVEQLEFDSSEGMFKLRHDPRITRPGRWMRRFSLDELPQLWNVLRGEMSLVGPRPPLPMEVEAYDLTASRRLRVRPGMTGLWQVSGRSDLSWTETIRLDVYYVDNWSMLQDLVILARTARAVLRPSGAY